MLVGASTALRIAAPLVGHCSSRRQWNKHVLRTPQKRREERARVRVQLEESSSWAIQNSLGSLSIGQVVNGKWEPPTERMYFMISYLYMEMLLPAVAICFIIDNQHC